MTTFLAPVKAAAAFAKGQPAVFWGVATLTAVPQLLVPLTTVGTVEVQVAAIGASAVLSLAFWIVASAAMWTPFTAGERMPFRSALAAAKGNYLRVLVRAILTVVASIPLAVAASFIMLMGMQLGAAGVVGAFGVIFAGAVLLTQVASLYVLAGGSSTVRHRSVIDAIKQSSEAFGALITISVVGAVVAAVSSVALILGPIGAAGAVVPAVVYGAVFSFATAAQMSFLDSAAKNHEDVDVAPGSGDDGAALGADDE